MRKIQTSLCLVAACTAFAQQDYHIMTVVNKDGTKTTYRVDDVQEVTFAERQYTELENQWALNEEVNAVSAVLQKEDADSYTFSIFSNEQPDMTSVPDIVITLPKEQMGKDIDIATTEGVSVTCAKAAQITKGTMKLKFDKFGKNIAITVNAESGSDDIRCTYNGAFGKTYVADGMLTVGDAAPSPILSALTVEPAATGEATSFAFSDVETTTADGVKEGQKAVWLSISAAKLYNGSIDMAENADSYTFKYIDYATRTVYDKVTAGTILSATDFFGNTYITVDATLEDGTTVNVSYLGKPTVVESLDAIIPLAVDDNQLKYYDSDGNVTLKQSFGMALIQEKTDKTIFYLYPEGTESKYSSDNRVKLTVGPSMINAGEISLASLGDTDVFEIIFNAIQLQSHASGHGYGNEPNNGTLKVSKDDDGNYDIYVDVTNKYNNPGMGYVDKGDNTKVVLHYKGTFENY